MFANVGLVKTFIAGGSIAKNRIVKFGADDRLALQATAALEKFAGVSEVPGVSAITGDPIDVIKSGIANILYGGAVTVGDFLTSDDEGRAVVAADGDSLIGVAQITGVEGDLGAVQIQFGTHYIAAVGP